MWVTAAGVKTHYQHMGQGPWLVLLHGWGCDWQIWSPIITSLSEDFHLIIPDLPAFGESETPAKSWNSNDYAKWLIEFLIQTVPAEQAFSLAGHSFGGKIAALYAAAAGDARLQQLVLIDPSGLPDTLTLTKQIQKNVLSLIPDTIKRLIPRSFRHQLLHLTQNSTDYFFSSEAQRQIFRIIYQENIRAQLPQIKVPTLLLWGANDIDTPVSQAHVFGQLIPDSQLTVFEGSGHFPFVDQPIEFVASLKEFIPHA